MAGMHNVLQSYVDPRASALQGIAAGMDPAQKYLLAMAHRISPSQLGLSPQQINYYEQGLTGVTMNPNTGQIMNNNTGQPVDPSNLMATANTNMGGNIAGSGALPATAGYNMTGTPGSASPYGSLGQGTFNGSNGQSVPGLTGNGIGSGVSNIGGGAGNLNNTAGLVGNAGNAVRQQMMDSTQFNPNGANTYAIQNMNLSGQGDLGSNMGGTGTSNGLFGGAVNTANATNNASQVATGQPIPQTITGLTGTTNPVAASAQGAQNAVNQLSPTLQVGGSTGTTSGSGTATSAAPTMMGGAMAGYPTQAAAQAAYQTAASGYTPRTTAPGLASPNAPVSAVGAVGANTPQATPGGTPSYFGGAVQRGARGGNVLQ